MLALATYNIKSLLDVAQSSEGMGESDMQRQSAIVKHCIMAVNTPSWNYCVVMLIPLFNFMC